MIMSTAGNVLGSVVNWLLGRYLERWHYKRWVPLSEDKLRRVQRVYQRFGQWALPAQWHRLETR